MAAIQVDGAACRASERQRKDLPEVKPRLPESQIPNLEQARIVRKFGPLVCLGAFPTLSLAMSFPVSHKIKHAYCDTLTLYIALT